MSFQGLRQTRINFLQLINDLSEAELNQIPEGFNNNIIWNFAHIIIAQQLLCYKLSNLPMHITSDLVDRFKKGSKPEGIVGMDEINALKTSAITLIDQLDADLKANIFETYIPYPTSYGIALSNIEDAIRFEQMHEALHLGYSNALKRVVTLNR